MKEIRLWIPGRIPSKKNSKRITKNRRIISSKQYLDWEKEKLVLIKNIPPIPWESVSITIYLYFPDKRRTDSQNKCESLFDLLTLAKIIPDDDWTVLREIKMVAMGVNKENPGALIVITKAETQVIELFDSKAA